jgi:hypothetical protein
MRGTRAVTLALVTTAAVFVAGCELLFSLGSVGDGEFEQPEPLATYTSGTATLEFEDGTKVVLDEISDGPHLFTQIGGGVNWFNDEGWGLQLHLYDVSLTGNDFSDGIPMLDRIQGGTHWTTMEGTGCSLKIDVADETGLRGTARCIEQEWVDALRAGTPFEGRPRPVEGEEPFDFEVTFEAER